MHHANLAVCSSNVISLCGLAKQIAAHYPELDVDLLLTPPILARRSASSTNFVSSALSATPSKQLLGHIMMEFETFPKHGRHRRFSR